MLTIIQFPRPAPLPGLRDIQRACGNLQRWN